MDAAGRRAGIERRHLFLFALALAILLALGLVGLASTRWRSREVDVSRAWQSPGGTRIVLAVPCFDDLRSRVEETDREVRFLVTTRTSGYPGDCGGRHDIILAEPLGDRVLIDDFDGEPVPVELAEWIPDAP